MMEVVSADDGAPRGASATPRVRQAFPRAPRPPLFSLQLAIATSTYEDVDDVDVYVSEVLRGRGQEVLVATDGRGSKNQPEWTPRGIWAPFLERI